MAGEKPLREVGDDDVLSYAAVVVLSHAHEKTAFGTLARDVAIDFPEGN